MGSHFLLQGILPTQGLNPGLQYCRQILYRLSHEGSHYRNLCRGGAKAMWGSKMRGPGQLQWVLWGCLYSSSWLVGEGCSAGGRFNNTLADLLLCPGYWARCQGREGKPLKLCARWGAACSSVESSCIFLYLDSIFVKQEDLFDRAPVFHV